MTKLGQWDNRADEKNGSRRKDSSIVQVIVIVLSQCSEICMLSEWERVWKTCRDLSNEVPAHLSLTTYNASSVSPAFLHACARLGALKKAHNIRCSLRGINLSFSSSCSTPAVDKAETLIEAESLGNLKEAFSIPLRRRHSVSHREAKLPADVKSQLSAAWAFGVRPLWDRRITPRLMHMVWNQSIMGESYNQIYEHTSFLRLLFKYASNHPTLVSISHYQNPMCGDCSPMRRPRYAAATMKEFRLLISARDERYGPGRAPFRYNSVTDRLLMTPADFNCAICHETLFHEVGTFGICTPPGHPHAIHALIFQRPLQTALPPCPQSLDVHGARSWFCSGKCHSNFGTPLIQLISTDRVHYVIDNTNNEEDPAEEDERARWDRNGYRDRDTHPRISDGLFLLSLDPGMAYESESVCE